MTLLLNIRFVLFSLLLFINSESKPSISINIVCDTFIKSNSNDYNFRKGFKTIFSKVITSDSSLINVIGKLKKQEKEINIKISFSDKIGNSTTTNKMIVVDLIRPGRYSSTLFYKSLQDLKDNLEKEDVFLQKGIHNFLVIGFMHR